MALHKIDYLGDEMAGRHVLPYIEQGGAGGAVLKILQQYQSLHFFLKSSVWYS